MVALERRSHHSLTGNAHESAAHCSSCAARVRSWPWMISLPISRSVVSHERSQCPYPRGTTVLSATGRDLSLPVAFFAGLSTTHAARATPVVSFSISAQSLELGTSAGTPLHSPGWRQRESSSARRLRVVTTLPKQSYGCPPETLAVDGCVCRHAFELSRLRTMSALGRASIMFFG